MKLKLFTFTFLTFCLAIASETSVAKAATLTTLADGLNNAQGISFGPDGSLYVGESGLGGNGGCQVSPSTQGQLLCAGNTGSVTKIAPDGRRTRLFEGFESLALQPSQNQGAGPQKIQFDSQGNAYLLTGYAGFPGNRDPEINALSANVSLPPLQYVIAPPVAPDQTLNTPTLGKLYRADLNTGELTTIFDFARYELFNNPDGGDFVSNPYALVIKDDTAYVADGGGNTVYSIKLDGSDTRAIPVPTQIINNPEFPPPSPDLPPGIVPEGPVEQLELTSVTTGITVGPDGGVYFGEYTGFPYPEGKARIFRLTDDGVASVFAEGFTHITDLAFDKNGNLLVLQFSNEAEWKGRDIRFLPGSLIQVAPDGTRTTLVAAGEGLESAIGITVDPDDNIYITKRGVGTLGEVVRVDSFGNGGNTKQIPEPSSVLGLLAFGVLGGSKWLQRQRLSNIKH